MCRPLFTKQRNKEDCLGHPKHLMPPVIRFVMKNSKSG